MSDPQHNCDICYTCNYSSSLQLAIAETSAQRSFSSTMKGPLVNHIAFTLDIRIQCIDGRDIGSFRCSLSYRQINVAPYLSRAA